MRSWLFAALLSGVNVASAAAIDSRATVPIVHCAVDEETNGAQATSQTMTVDIDPNAAKQLAYFASAPAPGVFGPKGWSCHAWQGSSGSLVLVTPKRIDPPFFPLPSVDSPAVMIQTSDRSSTGRFHVAIMAAQLFSLVAGDFIEGVRQEHLIADKSLQPQSFPDDQVRYLSDRFVSYTTPANQTGLGTESLFEPSNLPVTGLTFLSLDTVASALTEVRIRLPSGMAATTAAIMDLETGCVQLPKACAIPAP